jgi:hypothetical protein
MLAVASLPVDQKCHVRMVKKVLYGSACVAYPHEPKSQLNLTMFGLKPVFFLFGFTAVLVWIETV